MRQTSGITSVFCFRLKHYTLVDQSSFMLLRHFLRQELARILPPALYRSYGKQFDIDHFRQKPKKFLAIQFVCLAQEN